MFASMSCYSTVQSLAAEHFLFASSVMSVKETVIRKASSSYTISVHGGAVRINPLTATKCLKAKPWNK